MCGRAHTLTDTNSCTSSGIVPRETDSVKTGLASGSDQSNNVFTTRTSSIQNVLRLCFGFVVYFSRVLPHSIFGILIELIWGFIHNNLRQNSEVCFVLISFSSRFYPQRIIKAAIQIKRNDIHNLLSNVMKMVLHFELYFIHVCLRPKCKI